MCRAKCKGGLRVFGFQQPVREATLLLAKYERAPEHFGAGVKLAVGWL